jgi:hypothetical protein
MKRFLILLFLLPFLASGQTLKARINSDIRGKIYDPAKAANMYQAIVDSLGNNSYTGNSPTTVTVGGLSSGSNISNLPISDVIQSIVAPDINPVFTSFSVSGQSQTVEVTTTLSGARTFTWSIAANSGVVPTVTIYDNTTASDLLAGTPNDGSQSITITTIKLSTNGQTQSWRAIGNNTSPTSTFTSGNFDVTARFYLWHGAVSTVPTTSAGIRALPSNQFYVGGTTFTLNTGTLKDFMVALPIGRAITNVIDLDALNANITGQYVLQTPIAVVLADGTTTSTYSIYKNTIASAYSSNHRHQITIN